MVNAKMNSTFRNQSLQQNEKLFEKAVQKTQIAYAKDDFESTVAWAKIAAHFAFVRHSGIYTSPNLENLLLAVAGKIEQNRPGVNGNSWLKFKPKDYGKMRFLHVITEGYFSGGHTPFIARWADNTAGNSVHSLITTAHNGPFPGILTSSIVNSGGWFGSLSELSNNLLEQALYLRKIARSWADVIVLFIHPFDPLPIVAFGVDGGPPVIFVNHADHAFWLGSSIADVMIDYHPSGGVLSAKVRGISNSKILPIPLPKNEHSSRNTALRKELGIGDEEVMLLTVGRDEKYLPFGNYNFFEVMVKILQKHPNAKLFAVGPKNQDRWQRASLLTEGRIRAMGAIDRSTLEKYYNASDLFVEGFPCGSGTAMLEAGMHNLPMIGLSMREIPHITDKDDVALAKLSVHALSVQEFSQTLDYMIDNFMTCRKRAEVVKENIEREHCFPGWNAYLDEVLKSLPFQHHVRKLRPIKQQADVADDYLAYVGSEMLLNEPPELSLGRLVGVYSNHLHKAEVLKAQAGCFIDALQKVENVKQGIQFLYNFKEFITSAIN